ncbi:hypothetical protein M501DRAFT_1013580 [Patellaria atrata CBS 101060]|uniref:Pre-mRNA-splicing factor cef1 n=1 Tax=Patellaria atrata CBS 101060 TaxID=1346257 RepID=A0A9P4SG07_9PEZI|nr:hypothetical protein M501DRAFT_1013580 [Patellaria atrata CBS 101060]
MPVSKGGVWTNIEDEVLKASVSKYGLNQWARVSSLLARKSAKQCKARWQNWLDPSIKKTEWSREEDERLLHLAKLMPTQWHTISTIVGRTPTMCLERYGKLLDEAEAKEGDELGFTGQEGGEAAAPSADDVRKLRPGELDPDPESKPARPDTIDLDEDEKEMLSEARARLANTQGKKAKRKARERQLEESRRLAVLQKRRELKTAGINIKVVTHKKGQMDYNADIPFEKAPAPGFFDTQEEAVRNEREREAFDPRKQQLANKRKGDGDDEMGDNRKRRKDDKDGQKALAAAAIKAGQMQMIREAERNSKRRALNLPAPQVSESELEDIVKMGMTGERASQLASASENDATRGLVSNYSNIVGSTPIRTPRAPQEEDRIANEIRNARARTETQSALFGGENTPLHEGSGTTGFGGIAPSRHETATPNPMATPFRQTSVSGVGATPMRGSGGPGATPMRTPRDSFHLNKEDGIQIVGQTPRDIKLREKAVKQDLRSQLASLPKPKETEWELELPEEQQEPTASSSLEEDSAIRDQRNLELRKAAEAKDFKRQSQVVQKALPRPTVVDADAMLKQASEVSDPVEREIATEFALLIVSDAMRFGGAKVNGSSMPLEAIDDDVISKARKEIALELSSNEITKNDERFEAAWLDLYGSSILPGLAGYGEDEIDENQLLVESFDDIQDEITAMAERGNKVEKKLALHLGGYQQRAKALRQKLSEASEALEKAKMELDTARTAQIAEEGAIPVRLESLRDEVAFISRREREAQELYRSRKEELDSLPVTVNGYH